MTPERPRLGVNVDHVATVRQARHTSYPDPVTAASISELAGADQITIHLRQDRRHIQPRDLEVLRQTVTTRLNLEMAATDQMVDIARAVEPDMVTLVPENRDEQTTEGGLAVADYRGRLGECIDRLRPCGAHISLFIDPDLAQITASADLGAEVVELHTGDYCEAAAPWTNANRNHTPDVERGEQLQRLADGARRAADLDLTVAAGHGLDYDNVGPVAAIEEFEEFNIGHSIVSRAVLVGFERAVGDMIDALARGRARGANT